MCRGASPNRSPPFPLTLFHGQPPYRVNGHNVHFWSDISLFRCGKCWFDLDIRRALSTLSDQGGSPGGKTPEQIDLPLHYHWLTSFATRHDFVGDSDCVICKASVEGDGYTCFHNECEFIIHKRCVQDLYGDEYGFNLDVSCSSSTLLDRGGSEGKTPKWIALPLHDHLVTSFSTRYDFVRAINCVICKASVEGEGDGYVCLNHWCKFIIHKRCIQDLYYADGTKAPRIYHGHPLETFLGEDTGSSRCAKCRSDASSGEFVGCASCQVFYCRDCIQVPEIIQHPHHPKHNVVLLIDCPDNNKPQCYCCALSLKGKLCYGCLSCKFFVDMGCAQVLPRSEEGLSAKIILSSHDQQLYLEFAGEYFWHICYYCEDRAASPMYCCREEDCNFQLHKRCTEIESTIIHPHHPDHPLTLCRNANLKMCEACNEFIHFLNFSCKLCGFYLHAKCAAHVPTRKHALHEHELLHLDNDPFRKCKCNRCGTDISSPFFRCVPCNFNLHEECMELPRQVENSNVHWHPLTLHEYYVEDDTGEYYCDHCEKRRDERMGVYVCGQCKQRWTYHIECVLPELREVCAKSKGSAIKRLADDIARREEEIREVEKKQDEMKRELEEQRKKHAAFIHE